MAAVIPLVSLEAQTGLERFECFVCDPDWQEIAEGCIQGAHGCELYNGGFAVLFGVLFIASFYQMLRFLVIKLVVNYRLLHVNRLAATFVGISALRFARFSILALDIKVPKLMLDLLYLGPLLLAFTGLTVLIQSWTLLHYAVTGKGKNTLARLPGLLMICNFFVYCLTLTVFYYDYPSSPYVVVLACLATILLFIQYGLRKYMKYQNIKHSISGASVRFRKVTLLCGAVLASLATMISLIGVFTFMNNWNREIVSFLARHLISRLAEIFHVVVQLSVLNTLADVSHFPLPDSPKNMSKDWLVSVLREAGIIQHPTTVTDFQAQTLRGGCHFKVAKTTLKYSEHVEKAPKSVVVKILSWDHTFFEKLKLLFKRMIRYNDKPTMYVRSYQIEHRFYRNYAHKAKGLTIPRVFYNLEDTFNVQFGMVMEDISSSRNGEPHGFSIEECRLILKHLAKFHARFWEHSRLKQMNLWNCAGYWTGDKREGDKRHVKTDWPRVVQNFKERLPILAALPTLGERLERHMPRILAEWEAMEPKTLLHGDFKVSNVFIGGNGGRSSSVGRSEGDNHHDDVAVVVSPDIHCNGSNIALNATKSNGKNGKKKKKPTKEIDEKKKKDPTSNAAGGENVDSIADVDRACVYAIDWQWFGLGAAGTDVAHFMINSACAQALEFKNLKDLLKTYHTTLMRNGVPKTFAFKQFYHQYQLSVIDFFMYIIVAKWAQMTPADIIKHAEKLKNGLVMRSFPHMQLLIQHSVQFLDEMQLH